MKKRLFFLVLIIFIVLGSGGFFLYSKADGEKMPNLPISLNGVEVSPSGGSWNVNVLPSFFPKALQKLWVIHQAVDGVAYPEAIAVNADGLQVSFAYPYEATITDSSDNIVYSGSDLEEFKIDREGDYNLSISASIFKTDGFNGWGTINYQATLKADCAPKINVSNASPLQGELVIVRVENLFDSFEIAVDSEVFKPGAVCYEREKHSAFFYLPITYYKPTGEYSFTVKAFSGNSSFENTVGISVQPYEFSQISFTVDEETTSSTVNSAAANAEYRNTIHPLYYTKDENVYWSQKLIKPVAERRVSSQFGQMRFINNSKTPQRHSGIDYAADLGTPVYAAADGKVEYAGFLKLSGNTVVIEHGLGFKSYYFHMDSLNVSTGQMVKQSDKIGEVGTTGYSTGPHLHFQVSIENQPVNPELLY